MFFLFIVDNLGIGTIKSPWLPITSAYISFTEVPVISEIKYCILAESSTGAIPITLFDGRPETLYARYVMASRGFVTIIKIVFGDCSTMFFIIEESISEFLAIRSSRDIPGFRANPAVITTTSEFWVSL